MASQRNFRRHVAPHSELSRPGMVQVSVVITTFNLSHYLARAIESVKANTVQPLEIVVVDDGSRDHLSEEICGRYQGVRYFRQMNQGVSVARNKGAAMARADWVIFVDADDWLLPNAIEELATAAAQSPGVGFVIGRGERRSADPSFVPFKSPVVVQTGDPYKDLAVQNTEWHPAQVLFNKARVLEDGGFVLKHGAEDFEVLLRLAVRYPYKIVPGVVSVYWQHSMNVTGNPWRQYRSIDLCFRAHREDPKFFARSRAAFRAAWAKRLDFYGRAILVSGLSEIRKGNQPMKQIRGMGIVAIRRPPVLAWFFRFLLLLVIRRFSSHAKSA